MSAIPKIMMFPRGHGPLATIMIASRGRADSLKKAITAAYDLAQDKSLVEFVLKLDEDDTQSLETVNQLAKDIPAAITAIISPRGRGFVEMCGWVNQMCAHARGDWLILLNDDAQIITPDWDQTLLYGGTRAPRFGYESIFLFLLQHSDEEASFAFPCLRRKTFEILGHFSQAVACDDWIRRIVSIITGTTHLPIEVKHNRLAHDDATRRGIVHTNEFMNWQLICIDGLRKYIDDIDTLVRWLDDHYQKLTWKTTPDGNGWHWWKVAETAMNYFVFVYGDSNDQAILFPYAADGDITKMPVSELKGLWARPETAYLE